jgi:hypothetical protein
MANPSKSLIHSSESHPWAEAISSKYLEFVRNMNMNTDIIIYNFKFSIICWPFTKKGIARWIQYKSQKWYNWVRKEQLSRPWKVTQLFQMHKVLGDNQSTRIIFLKWLIIATTTHKFTLIFETEMVFIVSIINTKMKLGV